jgi:ATP/maltotriose-dependent transcriptional regulator MalT
LNTQLPLATLIQNYWLPAIEAEIELQRGNSPRAIELLHKAKSYELADTSMPMIPVYVRGEAYLRGRQGEPAAAEFQKIIQHRGLVGNNEVGALAHLGLARAYLASGDIGKARSAYQDLSELWKDAGPDMPVLMEAKAENSKLK